MGGDAAANSTYRRGTDSTSPVLTRQDHLTSSGLQGATAGINGLSSTRGIDTPVDEANAEPDATGAISDRDDAGVMTSTGAAPSVHERSEGPSADAVSERAANTVTTSTGAHSSSNDPSETPVSEGASAGSMTSAGTGPAGDSSTPTTRELDYGQLVAVELDYGQLVHRRRRPKQNLFQSRHQQQ